MNKIIPDSIMMVKLEKRLNVTSVDGWAQGKEKKGPALTSIEDGL